MSIFAYFPSSSKGGPTIPASPGEIWASFGVHLRRNLTGNLIWMTSGIVETIVLVVKQYLAGTAYLNSLDLMIVCILVASLMIITGHCGVSLLGILRTNGRATVCRTVQVIPIMCDSNNDKPCLVACITLAGETCEFPFFYKDKWHYECITHDNDGTPWCATDGNIGNCTMTRTDSNYNYLAHFCHGKLLLTFPYTHNNPPLFSWMYNMGWSTLCFPLLLQWVELWVFTRRPG